MKKNSGHFYEKYIDLSDIRDELRRMNMTEKETDHLASIAHKTIHIEISYFILTEIDEKYKIEVINQLENYPHERATEVLVRNAIIDFPIRVQALVENVKQIFILSLRDIHT